MAKKKVEVVHAVEEPEVDKQILHLSKIGLARYSEFSFDEDSNGVEAVGVVFNAKSKIYLFNPAGKMVKVGDVVEVPSPNNDKTLKVPVVLSNIKVSEDKLTRPFKDIGEILYRSEYDVEAVKKVTAVKFNKVIFYSSSSNSFKIKSLNANVDKSQDEIKKVILSKDIQMDMDVDARKMAGFINGKITNVKVQDKEYIIDDDAKLKEYVAYAAQEKDLEIIIKG